eukprot:TRINITY_DN4845_c0_g1_i1.p1 TRINITY_DN4845_c0_g1~~TRINITY_DN4845_c0_g1_i1.p1  ORF type:complete len:591 (+),score=91.02 TRINITY_DN4845_c0_g1_i1:119-1774(+)
MNTLKDVIEDLRDYGLSVEKKAACRQRESIWSGITEIEWEGGEDLCSTLSSSSVRDSPFAKRTWSSSWGSPPGRMPSHTVSRHSSSATSVARRLPSEVIDAKQPLPVLPSPPIPQPTPPIEPPKKESPTATPSVVAPKPAPASDVIKPPPPVRKVKKGPPPLKIGKLSFTDKQLRPVEKVSSQAEVEQAAVNATAAATAVKNDSPTNLNATTPFAGGKSPRGSIGKSPSEIQFLNRSVTPPRGSKNTVAGRPWTEYNLESQLGAGAFGQVFKAYVLVNDCRCTVAVKKIPVQTDQLTKELSQEISWVTTSKPKHPCIVDTLDIFHVPQKFELWIVQEFMSKGSLDKVVGTLHCKRLDEMITASIVHQLLQALDFLKSQKYLHRDIKPANVLVNERGCVKLADFGAATYAGTIGVAMSFGQGTQAYMSPERLRGDPYSGASDVWSAGLITAELIMGSFPFSAKGFIEQIDVRKSFSDSLSTNVLLTDRSSEVVEFIKLSMLPNPEHRATSTQLLAHQFIKNHCMGGHGHSSSNVRNWLISISGQDPSAPPMR